MDADWYEDPLGRFEGRFFDGEVWTERVSDNGSLAIDPEFPPTAPASSSEPPPDTPDTPDEPSRKPAVSAVVFPRHLQASRMKESPVRTVAVLDESVVASAISSDGGVETNSRAPLAWGLLGLIAALVVAGLVLLNRDQSPSVADAVELDQQQEQRVQDLEQGGFDDDGPPQQVEELEVDAPVGAVDPETEFAASEMIEVGGLQVLNGTSALDALAAWHQEFVAGRRVVLDADAGCWFGQLGGAAVQVAHCGPVGGTAETEFLFDSVPLVFEEANGGQIAQPVVDAATPDVVLANALTLVGRSDNPPPN